MAKESHPSWSYRLPGLYTPADYTPAQREITPEELPGEAYLAAAVALLLALVVIFTVAVSAYFLFIQ
jgi:hypothetical protein